MEVAASLPLAAEAAEWYPDLYVARPTTRLVYRFRAGDPPVEITLSRKPPSADPVPEVS